MRGQRHAKATTYPRERPGTHCVQEAGWASGPDWKGAENFTPTGILSPDRPARRQLLYRLRYLAYHLPVLNLLNPTGRVKHHQFNIQQLYALPTLYLCVLYLSENKQRLVPLTA